MNIPGCLSVRSPSRLIVNLLPAHLMIPLLSKNFAFLLEERLVIYLQKIADFGASNICMVLKLMGGQSLYGTCEQKNLYSPEFPETKYHSCPISEMMSTSRWSIPRKMMIATVKRTMNLKRDVIAKSDITSFKRWRG